MSTDLLCRMADAEARAHVRFGAGGQVARFGPLVAVSAARTGDAPLPLDTGWLSSERPPSESELADFEAFSARQGQAATLHLLSPQAPAALPLLTARGYTLDFVLHAYAHDLKKRPPLQGVPVREVSDPEGWADLAAEGFGPGTEAVMRAVGQAAGTRLFVAEVDGQAAATGAVHLQGGIAALHGTATRPACRGRGAQTALLAHRLQWAAQAGADLATVFVTPGSPSERNVMRAGFRLVGMRLTFTRR